MKSLYTKTYNFFTSDPAIRAKVELNLKVEKNRIKFSCSGDLRDHGYRLGGQNLEDILQIVKPIIKAPEQNILQTIYTLWEEYHLNNINAGCKHQRAANWGKKVLNIAELRLNDKTWAELSQIEKRTEQELKEKGHTAINPEEKRILNLNRWPKIALEDFSQYEADYKIEKTEKSLSTWIYEKDHKEGVFCKPCPICGYKYGSAWKYKKITDQALNLIIDVMGTPETDRAELLELNSKLEDE